MEISPILLLWLLVASVVFGILVGILNDVYRITRIFLGVKYAKGSVSRLYENDLPFLKRPLRELRNGKAQKFFLPFVILLQDVFLFSFAAVGIVVLNYYFNDGQFRCYTVVAVFSGFLFYYFTLGKLLIFVSEYLVYFLRSTFVVFGWLLCRPICLFVGFFWKKSKNIYAKVKKTIAKKQKMVYNIDKYKSVFQEAKHGFLTHQK